jgi:hypothetical protein
MNPNLNDKLHGLANIFKLLSRLILLVKNQQGRVMVQLFGLFLHLDAWYGNGAQWAIET